MKKITGMVLGVLALLPLAAWASVTVTANAYDTGVAVLYNPDNGAVIDQVYFGSGTAVLSTDSLSDNDKYAVTMNLAGGNARTDIYWDTGSAAVSGYTTFNSASPNTAVTALAGTTGPRGYTINGTSRTLSVNFRANGDLTGYNDNYGPDADVVYEPDANLLVYRPSTSAELTADYTQQSDFSKFTGYFNYSASPLGATGYDLITVTHYNDSFYAEYVGTDMGGGVYDLLFTVFDDPGGSAYNTGLVTSEADGSLTFSAESTAMPALEDYTPYYVMMEGAWMYDEAGNYSLNGDAISVTNPDYYNPVVPEPGVLSLMLAGFGLMVAFRRRTRN